MSKKKYILVRLSIISAVIIITIMSNPLRWSEYTIKNRLLKLTPVGTNMDSVINTLKSKKNYEIMYVSYKHGYGMANNRPVDVALSFKEREIGEKSIKVYLGEYRVIFCVDVVAYYGFNDENELIDVAVKKYYEAI